eukprot:6849582-Prymnesium_polylepis.1
MQPVGGPGTSPPTAIEMQASTALPDRRARSRSHRPCPPLPPLSPPPSPRSPRSAAPATGPARRTARSRTRAPSGSRPG